MPLHTDDLPPCPAGARCVPDLLASAADLIDGGGLAKHRRSGPGPALSVEGAIQAAYRLKGADPEHHGMGPCWPRSTRSAPSPETAPSSSGATTPTATTSWPSSESWPPTPARGGGPDDAGHPPGDRRHLHGP